MTHEEFILGNINRLIEVAQSMLQGKINLIAGIRLICELRFLIDDKDNKVFLPLRGYDSETDHFPLGREQELWAEPSLKKMNVEMERYISETKEDILQYCTEIIAEYSTKKKR